MFTLLIAFVSVVIPYRRVLRINPIVAMRNESSLRWLPLPAAGPELKGKFLLHLGHELRDPFARILRIEGLDRQEAPVAAPVDQAL